MQPSGEATPSTSLLLRLSRQITARHDLDDVLSETLRALRPLLPFGGGSIQLIDDEGWIRMAAAEPAAPEHVMAQRVPLGGSVGGRVVLSEQPVHMPDIIGEVSDDRREKTVSGGVRSYIGVPLVADGHAIGLLQLDSPEADAWTVEQRELLLCISPVVAAAIQNARAHARATAADARAGLDEKKLAEARRLAATARACLDAGDGDELERQLTRLEQVLAEGAIVKAQPRLPMQRTTTTDVPTATQLVS
jgi:GAF domain-containing protein